MFRMMLLVSLKFVIFETFIVTIRIGDVSDEGMVHLHYDGLDAVEEMSTDHTQEPQHMTSAGCTLPTTDKLQEHSNVMACKEDEPTCSSVNTEACITENIILPSSPVLEELPSDVQSDASGEFTVETFTNFFH